MGPEANGTYMKKETTIHPRCCMDILYALADLALASSGPDPRQSMSSRTCAPPEPKRSNSHRLPSQSGELLTAAWCSEGACDGRRAPPCLRWFQGRWGTAEAPGQEESTGIPNVSFSLSGLSLRRQRKRSNAASVADLGAFVFANCFELTGGTSVQRSTCMLPFHASC